ncbi:MAG TPA: hypothetical protein PLF13_14900 [candidate division Zixibacteria bacterium]|nr:hypothetical protein [candidate division Zixibacteria bacterium]
MKRRAALVGVTMVVVYALARLISGSHWGLQDDIVAGEASAKLHLGVEALVMTAIAVVMAFGVRQGQWTARDWGLRLNRAVWITGLVLLLLLVLDHFFGQPGPGKQYLLTSLANTFRLMSDELLMRVMLTSCLVVWLGSSQKGLIAAVLISAAVITVLRWPQGAPISSRLAGWLLWQATLTYAFYEMRSILLVLVVPLFPAAILNSFTFNPFLSLAIYFALALLAKYAGAASSTSKTGTTVSDTP